MATGKDSVAKRRRLIAAPAGAERIAPCGGSSTTGIIPEAVWTVRQWSLLIFRLVGGESRRGGRPPAGGGCAVGYTESRRAAPSTVSAATLADSGARASSDWS